MAVLGFTQMPGIDDFGAAETFTTAQAPALRAGPPPTASARCRSGRCSAITASCPGTKGAGDCSGVTQPTWYFSHVFGLLSYLP